MQVEGWGERWHAHDADELERILGFRDAVGGGQFWISVPDQAFPTLAIRISGTRGDVHYFPEEGHPGFRALSADPADAQEEAEVLFVYEGADPASGEWVLRQFVLPKDEIVLIAREFYRAPTLPTAASWFEL